MSRLSADVSCDMGVAYLGGGMVRFGVETGPRGVREKDEAEVRFHHVIDMG
jgi:hypothetical protein